MAQIQIQVTGELLTVTRQVAPGAKSAIVDRLVAVATRAIIAYDLRLCNAIRLCKNHTIRLRKKSRDKVTGLTITNTL